MHFVLIYKHLGWFLFQGNLVMKICVGLGTRIFSWFLIQRNTLYRDECRKCAIILLLEFQQGMALSAAIIPLSWGILPHFGPAAAP